MQLKSHIILEKFLLSFSANCFWSYERFHNNSWSANNLNRLRNIDQISYDYARQGEGEVAREVAVVSPKRWYCRNREDLSESPTPYHDAQVAGIHLGSNPVHLTVLVTKAEDYTTAPQHLQTDDKETVFFFQGKLPTLIRSSRIYKYYFRFVR